MIKLKTILNEVQSRAASGRLSSRRFTISSEKRMSLLKGPFSQADQRYVMRIDPDPLIRIAESRPATDKSSSSVAPFELIVPRRFERTSKDADNFYTILMGNLPSWKGWPRRSHSVIFFVGMPNKFEANHYGDHVYKVLPKNGANIAVSTVHDLLDHNAMKYMQDMMNGKGFGRINGLQSLGSNLKLVLEYAIETYDKNAYSFHTAQKTIVDVTDKDYPAIIATLNKAMNEKTIGHIIEYMHNVPEKSNFYYRNVHEYIHWMPHLQELLKTYGDWEGLLSEAFDPEKNGLQLMTPETVHKPPSSGRAVEAWTEDACILQYIGEGDDIWPDEEPE